MQAGYGKHSSTGAAKEERDGASEKKKAGGERHCPPSGWTYRRS